MQTSSSQNKKFTGSPSQFAFQAPRSRQVSLAGDFNNWDTDAAPMQKGADGIWRLSVPLAPGRHEYRFYVDGVWRDDPTAQQRAVNGLGSENCVRIIKDAGRVGTSVTGAIADVPGGAVRGGVQAGADSGHATQGIRVRVLRGTGKAGADVMAAVSHTAQVAIKDTAQVGGDLEAATSGLVQGAIVGANELGVGVEDAAAAAASGILKAASEVGPTALRTVRKAVTKPIKGVNFLPKEHDAFMN